MTLERCQVASLLQAIFCPSNAGAYYVRRGLLASVAMIFMPILEARTGIVDTMKNLLACKRVTAELPDVEVSKHGAVPADASTKPATKETV